MALTAKDIMTTELILGHPDMTIEEAIKALVNNRVTGLPVVDKGQRLVGVVSEYDIIKVLDASGKPANLTQKITFSSNVVTVPEESPLPDVLRLFVEKKIRRLPVTGKDSKLVGVITRRDVMRVIFYRTKTV